MAKLLPYSHYEHTDNSLKIHTVNMYYNAAENEVTKTKLRIKIQMSIMLCNGVESNMMDIVG